MDGHLRSTGGGSVTVAILDCEATSTDPHTAELLEVVAHLATVDHRGDEEGNPTIVLDDVVGDFTALNEPSCEIPQDVVDLTGITADTVCGHRIAVDALAAFLRRADLLIAHNAVYDRTLLERAGLPSMRWACSMQMIDWRNQLVGRSLPALAREFHLPYTETHRAAGDVQTLTWLLGCGSRWPHRRTHPTFLAELLASVDVDRGVLLMRVPKEPKGLYDAVKLAVPDARWCKPRKTLWVPCTRADAREIWPRVAGAYGYPSLARENVRYETVDITTDYERALGLQPQEVPA